MHYQTRSRLFSVVVASQVLLVPRLALATDGYFSSGYGMIENGRGGASIATADDAMGGANNPASMAFVPAWLDLGLSAFMPDRAAERSGNAFGLNGSANSGALVFPIPEFGYNRPLGDRWAVGLTVYGNGGMNTTYPGGQIPAGHCGPGAPASNLLCGSGTLGVDLTQLIIAPTLAYKITPQLAVGISPQIAIAHFAGQGLQAFGGVSSDPANLTNTGYSNSVGAGVKFGAQWQALPTVSLGVTYTTRTTMGALSGYQGLFAGGGNFDIPPSAGIGVAWWITPSLRLALDDEGIFYSDIKSVSNSSTALAPLGSSNGRGFGWSNINVVRIGFDYQAMPELTLRAGYNHSGNPVSARDVTFNILAPGVITDQVSAGFTYQITPATSLTFAYSHAFNNSVTGPTNPLIPGGGTDSIRLMENQVGFALEIKL